MGISELLLEILTSLLERLKEGERGQINQSRGRGRGPKYPSIPLSDSTALGINNLVNSIQEEHESFFPDLYRILVTDKSDLLLVTNSAGYGYAQEHENEIRDLAVLKVGCNDVYIIQVDEEASSSDIEEAVDILLDNIYGHNDLICQMLKTPEEDDTLIKRNISLKELTRVAEKLGLDEVILPAPLISAFLQQVLQAQNLEILLEANYLIEEEK